MLDWWYEISCSASCSVKYYSKCKCMVVSCDVSHASSYTYTCSQLLWHQTASGPVLYTSCIHPRSWCSSPVRRSWLPAGWDIRRQTVLLVRDVAAHHFWLLPERRHSAHHCRAYRHPVYYDNRYTRNSYAGDTCSRNLYHAEAGTRNLHQKLARKIWRKSVTVSCTKTNLQPITLYGSCHVPDSFCAGNGIELCSTACKKFVPK